MSRENVEIVRAAFDALFNGADASSAVAERAAGYEVDLSRMTSPHRGVYGESEARQAFAEFSEPWESQRFEVEEFIEVGEHVVTPYASYHCGRDGIEVRARAAFVWTVRDGRLARLCFYQDRAEALTAVGLDE